MEHSVFEEIWYVKVQLDMLKEDPQMLKNLASVPFTDLRAY